MIHFIDIETIPKREREKRTMNSLDITSSASAFARNKRPMEQENSITCFLVVTLTNVCFGTILLVSIMGMIN